MTVRSLAAAAAAGVLLTAGSASGVGAADPVFPSLGNAGYDAKHYDIALSWSAADGSIEARTTMTARATTSLTSVSLDLSGLRVAAVHVDGATASYSRSGHKLVIRPAAPIAAGSTFTTRVAYAGQPRTLTDADGSRDGWIRKSVGAVVLGEPRGAMTWFPNNNTPSDKATYDVAVEVPEGFQAIGNGRNTAVVAGGPTTTWRWSTAEPMASYLATVDIGRFTRHRYTLDGIRYDSFVAEGLPDNRQALRLLPRVLRAAERWFGRYPFADAGIIVDSAPVSYALETQNRPFFPGYVDPALLVHELAHQWFGDSVTPRTWNHIWLNEGFATYAEWLWRAEHGGPSTRRALRTTFRETVRWSPAPARVSAETLFDDAVYARGAMTLQALRERVGSRPFFRILKRWAREHRHAGATSRAFKKVAEEVSGRQLDRLFRDWLFVEQRPRGYVG